jgi:hypothetical protein
MYKKDLCNMDDAWKANDAARPYRDAALIGALRKALREQWEYNHAEHCTNMPHKEGDDCHWPAPFLLTSDAIPPMEPLKAPWLR